MEPTKLFKEFKRVIKYGNNSIASKEFYLKYCKKSNLNQGQCEEIIQTLDHLYPFNEGGWAPITHGDYGAVVAILPQSKEAEDKIPFGYASIDNHGHVCLLPDTGKQFYLKPTKNEKKVAENMGNLNDNAAYYRYKHYKEGMAPLLNCLLRISWITSMDLNFVVDYPHWGLKRRDGIHALCFNTLLTDNEIYLEDED